MFGYESKEISISQATSLIGALDELPDCGIDLYEHQEMFLPLSSLEDIVQPLPVFSTPRTGEKAQKRFSAPFFDPGYVIAPGRMNYLPKCPFKQSERIIDHSSQHTSNYLSKLRGSQELWQLESSFNDERDVKKAFHAVNERMGNFSGRKRKASECL